MNIKQRIAAFVQLSKLLGFLAKSDSWPGYNCGVNELEYYNFIQLIKDLQHKNAWFTLENVRQALMAWHENLEEKALKNWVYNYSLDDLEKNQPKRIGLILAGNIPLVGMHDVVTTLISGNTAVIKLSSDDNILIPELLKFLIAFEPQFESRIVVANSKLPEIDAIIATGSNNSSRYFEYYFSKYPHIIRKNRTSIAIVTMETSDENLKKLGKDIFDYFGLGCRNVTHILFPEGFDLNRFFTAIYDYNEIVNHNKYANNYDYYKALFMLNQEELLDNGFLLLRKHPQLHSSLGTLNYQFYSKIDDVISFINTNQEELQCVVSDSALVKNALAPGNTQKPGLMDYADGVDTMAFALSLKNHGINS